MNASKNNLHLILLGLVSALSDPKGELNPWMPGSGHPDDRLVTDQIIGALVRGGYVVVDIALRGHAVDVTLRTRSGDAATGFNTKADLDHGQEALAIATVLAKEFPEFHPTLLQVVLPDVYGIIDNEQLRNVCHLSAVEVVVAAPHRKKIADRRTSPPRAAVTPAPARPAGRPAAPKRK